MKKKGIVVGYNKWHHYAITTKNGKVYYYVDGKKAEITLDWWGKVKRTIIK